MITIWHNPRCSKSRQTLALLQERGDVTIRRYLKDAPTVAELKSVCALLGGTAIDMMRPKEAQFRELGLSKSDSDTALFEAMSTNPILIERPIVFIAAKAAIGRPPEAVLDIL